MEVFLIRALQLVLCLSLLIVLHEGGHFFFAKLFKVRVNKFSLFFDWKFALAKFKPKKSDTTYVLGWIPLGGYVEIDGMVDESLNTEKLKEPVKPWEFRAKPAWQRFFIMLGGVLVNFIVAIVLYCMILFVWGETYVPMRNMTYGLKYNETAQQLGFRDGDIPLSTNLGAFMRFDSNESVGNLYRDISKATSVTVLRDGKEVSFALPGDLDMLQMMKEQPPFATYLMPSLIDSVAPKSPGDVAGIHPGDRLVGFNGETISTWNEYNEIRGRINDVLSEGKKEDSLKYRHAILAVERAETHQIDTVAVDLKEDLLIGLMWNTPMSKYDKVTIEYNILSCIPAGIKHGWVVLSGYVSDLQYIFTKEGAESVGSFGAIGSLFPTSWDWQRFWELTAFISLILAFMNILPIPALDGGHIFFLLCEIITRRKPSDSFMIKAQYVGMTILLLLMAFAIFNDFRHFVF